VTVNKLGDLSSSSCLDDSLTPLSVLSQQQRLGEPKLLRVDITRTVHGPQALQLAQDVHTRAHRGHRISYLRWWVQWHGDENEKRPQWVASRCCAVLCCAVLCCAVLCCAVLCCAVLCCAVLCCAVLCCAVLCGRRNQSDVHWVD
jgi:hypothetical protein